MNIMSNHDDDEEYTGPEDWRRHKPYGAGISRKRINFVKAGSASEPITPNSTSRASSNTAIDISSFYLNLVLKGQGGSKTTTNSTPTATLDTHTPPPPAAVATITYKDEKETVLMTNDTATTTTIPITTEKKHQDEGIVVEDTTTFPICNVCFLPIDNPITHQHTLAHQSSLPHSELPHHLDRSSQGLKYLVSRGWDPDKKVGLGKEGAEGDRIPMAVKLKPKNDTVGLGVKNKDRGTSKGKERVGSGGSGGEGKVVKKRLDAKSARKEADKEKERRRMLAEYLNRS